MVNKMRDYEMLGYSNKEWDLILKLNPNFEKNCKNIIREHFDGKIDVKYVENIYDYICCYIDLTKVYTDDIIHMIIDIYYRHLTDQNVNISEYVYLYTYSNSEGFEISGLLNERFKEDLNKLENLIDGIQMCFPAYKMEANRIRKLIFLFNSAAFDELKEELYNLRLCCKLNKKDYSKNMLLEMFNLMDELEEIIKSGVFARHIDEKTLCYYKK